VGISSVAGDRGRKSNYIYGSAKAALTTYLSGLRNRLYDAQVHVMTVKPGFVATAMTKDLDLPEKLTAQPEEVAQDIYSAQQKNKNVIYTKWFWKYIMMIIRIIPEWKFKGMSL
jgi:short-subunit dehydrogenase